MKNSLLALTIVGLIVISGIAHADVNPCEMIYIPAGSFLMGNTGNEPYSLPEEFPLHSVYMSAYYIGKYPVTRGEYRQFIEAGGYFNPSYWSDYGWIEKEFRGWTQPLYWAAEQQWRTGWPFTQTDDHPVVGVSVYEAEAFCNWAGGHLPTEAQWEKAARGTGNPPNIYPWGDVWDAEKCNNLRDNNPAGGGYNAWCTSPADSYPNGASPYGCMDMAGNVHEFCKDAFQYDYYSQTPVGGWIDPLATATGVPVVRGGSFLGSDLNTRCSYRGPVGMLIGIERTYNYGFRLARQSDSPSDYVSISEAKKMPDESTVYVSGIVTLTQDTSDIYIEDENRISGIRIQTPDQGILPGDKVYAWGVVRTDANAERYLEKLVISTSGKGVVAPLCLTNKSLGGGAFGNVSEGKGQRGVTGGTGLNNIGLLVRTTGVCSFINEHIFSLDDGSGVVVLCETPPGITVSPAWQHVVVTGISSMQKNGDNYERLLKVRSIDYNIEMIDIPAGSFLMGNNGSESYSYPSELPQHSVYLSEYSISKYQITRGQYRAFMDAGGYTNPAYWSLDGWNWRLSANSFYPEVGPPRIQPSYWAARQSWGGGGVFSQSDDHPAVGVSYYEAEAFCNWAGGCLPTEAQWEKAARWTGSSPNVYPWGNVWDAEKCNNYYDHNPAGGGYFKFQTAPVGSYPAGVSPYGCHDMAGNVWEWCKDWYSDSYYSENPTGGWVDPRGPESGSSRSQRGGNWYSDENDCRCALRWNNDPNYSYYSLGFRLARKAR